MCVQSVAHELEFTIWGNEADRSVVLEARESDTLVELDVFHFDRFASRGTACGLEHNLIIQSQPQLWHTTQVALHLDGAQNLRSQDISVRRDEKVKGLNDIQEDFVLAVTNTLASP